MIFLVPKWAHEYNEFWYTIRRRNIWFIKLRYLAGISLFLFLLLGQYLFNFNLTNIQVKAFVIVGLIIFSYNVILQIVRPKISCVPGEFNCMHLSLVQIIIDYILLFFLVYYTGTIDSPLYVFFIFHTIIGSLILPGYLIYAIAAIVTFSYGSLIILQHFTIIENHFITGLYKTLPEHLFMYCAVFIFVFAIMMMISVMITNRIGANLLKRESQLRDTLKQLNEAEAAKQKYIMGVVHEIKTPIAAVQSMIDLVLQKFLGPISKGIENKLLRAHTRAEEAISLINNILRISKLKLLDFTSSDEINISELFGKLLEQQAEKAKAKNILLNYDDKRGEDKTLFADQVMLELAFSNLIGNSIKYNFADGNVKILILNEDENIRIDIIDDGVGIPNEDIDKIFNQFYRASNIKHKHHEGSGLGLYLVLEIVERHKGKIKVKSPVNEDNPSRPGTSLSIILPYNINENIEGDDIKTLSIAGRI